MAQSAVAPPGPIPNPVVTHRSAGEYCGVAPREARPLRAPQIGSPAGEALSHGNSHVGIDVAVLFSSSCPSTSASEPIQILLISAHL